MCVCVVLFNFSTSAQLFFLHDGFSRSKGTEQQRYGKELLYFLGTGECLKWYCWMEPYIVHTCSSVSLRWSHMTIPMSHSHSQSQVARSLHLHALASLRVSESGPSGGNTINFKALRRWTCFCFLPLARLAHSKQLLCLRALACCGQCWQINFVFFSTHTECESDRGNFGARLEC